MDIATIVGLIGGFAIILVAILLGGSLGLFIDVPSIMIVIVGSTFVVLIKFSLQKITTAVKIAMNAFMFKIETPAEVIEVAINLANIVRKEGPLGLEKVEIKNPYLKRGVQLLVDGVEADIIKGILAREKSKTSARHKEGQKIFRHLADVGPAMGMIGTLVGLVQMLANMSDPAAIGPAMAVALLTTMYGAILANVFAGPIADKLEFRGDEEEMIQSMIIDAISSIGAGHSRVVVQAALNSYLPKTGQVTEDDAGGQAAA